MHTRARAPYANAIRKNCNGAAYYPPTLPKCVIAQNCSDVTLFVHQSSEHEIRNGITYRNYETRNGRAINRDRDRERPIEEQL